MKKNILIISYSYPPLNVPAAQRPYALAKYLDKSKFNINVITCKNPMSYFGFNKNFDSNLDNVNVIKINSYFGLNNTESNSTSKNKVKKKFFFSIIKTLIFDIGQKLVFPDRGMFWYPKVKGYLKKNEELLSTTDVVISLSPMFNNHRIARYIKSINKNIEWIADFSDFHYVDGWESKKGIKAFMHKGLEESIIKESSRLNFVTKTMLKAYKNYYPSFSDKMYCTYNGFDKTDFPDEVESLNSDKVTIFYAGTFYNGLRSPLPLMKILDRAIDDNLLKCEEIEIQIAGNIEDSVKEEMKNFLSYQSINFLGSLPRNKALEQMIKATFLLLIVANIKSHYQTVPIKLFEYIAARRPIINFAPIISEPSQIIEEMNLGYNFNTLDFNLEESYSLFKKIFLEYKKGNFVQPLSKDKLENFTWEKQIDLFENLL